ncbi:MAG: hypothetical protein ACYTG5_21455 [Planctomycetota bacterium]|jgi:hypothetical protein
MDTTRALTEARAAIGRIAQSLRCLQRQISDLCSTLPEHGQHFDPRAELRSALHCVNADLIDDAIKTLRQAVTATAAQLRHEFDRRQQLRASPLDLHTPAAERQVNPKSTRRTYDETRTDPEMEVLVPPRQRKISRNLRRRG